jgi:hypothetical protein
MPDLFIDVEIVKDADGNETVVDPVLDIVTYLLGEGLDWHVADGEFSLAAVQEGGSLSQSMEDLLLVNLSDSFYEAVAKEYAQKGIPAGASGIKVAEEELRRDTSTVLDVDTKLVYIGRKALGKYGCYGCHDIPGFEDAKPIGAGLADWGRKDPSKLAFEHIAEYVHRDEHGDGEHGDGGHGDGGHGDVKANDHEHTERDVRLSRYDDDLSDFYGQQLHSHNRTGFIYQKLREPRSYDYHKTDGIEYNARLRMPLFPFSTEYREAVITFVLGLVADPPRTKYLYQPSSRAKALIDGKQVIDKYNCAGCHILKLRNGHSI